MQTIVLNGSDYATPEALHKSLRVLLNLPAYYGMNADALYDCLSERAEPVAVWLMSPALPAVQAALARCMCAFEDAGCTVTKRFREDEGQPT